MQEQKQARKPGRPKLAKDLVKRKYVPVRLTDEEAKLFARVAKASDFKTLSGWIRHTLREAANK